MSDTQDIGGCLCGAVRLVSGTPSAHMHACHCSICRLLTGMSQFAMDVADAVWEGEIATFASSDFAERAFCPKCGTTLFYRMLDSDAHSINPFILRDRSVLNFDEEIFIDNKPDGYAFAGDRPRKTEADVLAQSAPESD